MICYCLLSLAKNYCQLKVSCCQFHVKYVFPLCFRCGAVVPPFKNPFRNYRINGARAKDQRRMKGGRREEKIPGKNASPMLNKQ